MNLKQRIPKEFYKLFRTKNMDAYMLFLTAIYEENNERYASFGLTTEECRAIVEETILKMKIQWQEETEESFTEEAVQTATLGDRENELSDASPSAIVNRLVSWGWLMSDYDEKQNRYILSFPEYSQLFVELFVKLQQEDDGMERESILSIYSALYTYHMDTDRNRDILKTALHTSKRLGQMLSNMQDGMRVYFEKLAGQKDFIGIQKVLVDEINNNDSKKYAILTTTDSFYRYKEAVKELISQILEESVDNEAVSRLVYEIEHEFDMIERKYNKLIEQKAVFARRALARIHYIMQEGVGDENGMISLLRLLDEHENSDAILTDLSEHMAFTTQFRVMNDQSLYQKRTIVESEFIPVSPEDTVHGTEEELSDFVPRPLYTKKEMEAFLQKNTQDGSFVTSENTVSSIEDLEKLLFLWQEVTDDRLGEDLIELDGELHGEQGFAFSKLVIKERETTDV
ncbi:MAG: DUF5716 family protein [Lachnospiraceae bacterium]|nr:DUF5716 family protein [Lachnospiraceae bacterium]